MATSTSDVFEQEDSVGLGDDWLLIYGAPEVIDHAVVISDASPRFGQVIALHATALDSVEQFVRLRADLAGAQASDGIQLYARAEYLEVGSAYVLDKAYYLEMTEATLTLYSLLASESSPVQLATAALSLDSHETHNVAMKVRDNERGAQIDIFIDEEVSPTLTYVDRLNTRPNGSYAGFGIIDANTTQEISITEYLSYVLRSAVIKAIRPPVRLLSLGDLVTQCSYRLDRAGNSQFDESYMVDFINFAIDEIYNELTVWSWAYRTMCLNVAAETRYLELPPYVAKLYDLVDGSLGYQLSKVTPQQLNRADPRRARSGSAYSFTVTGRGDFGSLVVELTPLPNSDTVFNVPYYAKPVPLSEYNEIPLIPTQWLEVVIFGALKRAAQYDTDANFYQSSVASWERLVNRMKRQNYTDLKMIPRMETMNNLVRSKATSIVGPVTRAQQLGL
jgi:hypothetical protein